MVEVTIDSIRVSLVSPQRLIILKDVDQERFLPIWIGPFEAEAITIKLQDVDVKRPLTHDLLKKCITELGATVSHVLVNELRKDVFTLVEEIGKKEGYLLIINNFSVIYSPGSIDITDKLIKQMNDKYAKKSGN